MNLESVAKQIVDAAYQVHRALGPGLLESTYQFCFFVELQKKGLYVEKEKALPLVYRGHLLEKAFRIDVLVENKVIVELKSVESLIPIHKAQLITYLKLSRHTLGFLINFNVPRIKDGIQRIVYNYHSS